MQTFRRKKVVTEHVMLEFSQSFVATSSAFLKKMMYKYSILDKFADIPGACKTGQIEVFCK